MATSETAISQPGTDRRVLVVLLAMTLATGLVDAVSYLGPGHVFTANMTGNVALLGFAAAGAPRLSVARSLTSLFGFLFGAVLGGRLRLAFSVTGRLSWVFKVAACEAALLFCAAAAFAGQTDDSGFSATRVYTVIVLTAIAMGLRTSAMRQFASADVRTTVVTSTLAALAGDSFLAGGKNPHLGRRAGSAVVMVAGAAIGALLLRFGLAVPLLLGGIVVLAVTSGSAWLPSRARQSYH